MKKKIISTLLILFAVFPLVAQRYTEEDIHLYIEKYKDLAIRKMYEYKIPASITLAQGVFESACGTSRLATYGNNHFGIKCHKEWEGDTLLVDDDELAECFRKYEKVEESYNDHSLFLTSRPRYSKLFTLDIMDYKAWAKELKAAGYATNPQYAERLISLIERFDIAKHDTTYLERLESGYFTRVQEEPVAEVVKKEEVVIAEKQPEKPAEKPVEKPAKKSVFKRETGKKETSIEGKKVEKSTEVSPSQAVMSQRIYFKVDPKKYKPVSYPFSDRLVYENNKVYFVIAEEGETYRSIAADVQLPEATLRFYNDVDAGWEPQPGEVIYVDRKSKSHPAEAHTVKSGETLRLISQQYGVRLDLILKYNKLDINSIIHPEDKIKLNNR